jgi:hypothetical protein
MVEPAHRPTHWLRSRFGLAVLSFLAVAGFYVLTEHTAHVFGVLPYLLLLMCPLMHFFHGSHTHGHDGDAGPSSTDGTAR